MSKAAGGLQCRDTEQKTCSQQYALESGFEVEFHSIVLG